ncbi:MAG: hypothetical protein HC834_02170 [Rhodospirillales bacterium]|nr:hypothetical protein [Rhodospirillales bacterium]
MLKKTLILMVLGATLLIAACQNPPLYSVIDAPLGAPPSATLDQVRQAILFAGAKRDWNMEVEGPGKILASHQRSGHVATVEILYNTTTFTIQYLSSEELQYADGTVHPTYNRWIEYLEKDIQTYAAAI